MTRNRVQLTKQKARSKRAVQSGESDQPRARAASRRARSVAAAAARFLARTER